MRAAVFKGVGQPLVVETVADPTPGPGEIVLKVTGAGICGSDLHATLFEGMAAPGSIMGHEFAGEIAALGAGVSGWRTGEHVTALPVFPCRRCDACDTGLVNLCRNVLWAGYMRPGAFAEYLTVSAEMTQRIPAGVDDALAAMVEPLAVAHHTVARGEIRKGERVLVLGGGPIGAAVALWAMRAGAGAVVVSEPSAVRRERCRMVGVTAVIDPSQEDVASRFAALAGGAPEVVYECVGVAGMLTSAIGLAGLRGRVVVAGVVMEADSFAPMAAFAREVSIRYSQAYDEADFAAAIDALAKGAIEARPLHTSTVSLNDAPAAFENLRTDPAQMKVVIDPRM